MGKRKGRNSGNAQQDAVSANAAAPVSAVADQSAKRFKTEANDAMPQTADKPDGKQEKKNKNAAAVKAEETVIASKPQDKKESTKPQPPKKASTPASKSQDAPPQKKVQQGGMVTEKNAGGAAAAFLKQHNIAVTAESADIDCSLFSPYLRFEEIKSLHRGLVADYSRQFKAPTPIQAISWPILEQGYDLVSIAQTGSGKTLAFGIPAIVHAENEARKHGAKSSSGRDASLVRPSVLILLPTRELAMQVHSVLEAQLNFLAKLPSKGETPPPMRCVCLYGGMPKYAQIAELRKGANIVVATPGRLIDLVNEGRSLALDAVGVLVLDEADRMLDLGFEPDIRRLSALCIPTSAGRRSLMFSATWPVGVRALAREFMRPAQTVQVAVNNADDVMAAPQLVVQHVDVIDGRDRESRVQTLLRQYAVPSPHNGASPETTNRILVFALYKREAERLANLLMRRFNNVAVIQGDMSQAARNSSFDDFRSPAPGSYRILVATDVAARGLDIPDVSCVINATFPLTIEDYVHRIGRTGRAGRAGVAHTLFTVDDRGHAGELVNVLKQTNQHVPADLLKFGTTVKKKEHSAYGAFYKSIDHAATAKRTVFNSDNEE